MKIFIFSFLLALSFLSFGQTNTVTYKDCSCQKSQDCYFGNNLNIVSRLYSQHVVVELYREKKLLLTTVCKNNPVADRSSYKLAAICQSENIAVYDRATWGNRVHVGAQFLVYTRAQSIGSVGFIIKNNFGGRVDINEPVFCKLGN